MPTFMGVPMKHVSLVTVSLITFGFDILLPVLIKLRQLCFQNSGLILVRHAGALWDKT